MVRVETFGTNCYSFRLQTNGYPNYWQGTSCSLRSRTQQPYRSVPFLRDERPRFENSSLTGFLNRNSCRDGSIVTKCVETRPDRHLTMIPASAIVPVTTPSCGDSNRLIRLILTVALLISTQALPPFVRRKLDWGTIRASGRFSRRMCFPKNLAPSGLR